MEFLKLFLIVPVFFIILLGRAVADNKITTQPSVKPGPFYYTRTTWHHTETAFKKGTYKEDPLLWGLIGGMDQTVELAISNVVEGWFVLSQYKNLEDLLPRWKDVEYMKEAGLDLLTGPVVLLRHKVNNVKKTLGENSGENILAIIWVGGREVLVEFPLELVAKTFGNCLDLSGALLTPLIRPAVPLLGALWFWVPAQGFNIIIRGIPSFTTGFIGLVFIVTPVALGEGVKFILWDFWKNEPADAQTIKANQTLTHLFQSAQDGETLRLGFEEVIESFPLSQVWKPFSLIVSKLDESLTTLRTLMDSPELSRDSRFQLRAEIEELSLLQSVYQPYLKAYLEVSHP